MMKQVFVFGCVALCALGVAGCSVDTEDETEAVSAVLDELDTLDEGTSWNGWTVEPWLTTIYSQYIPGGPWQVVYQAAQVSFTKSFGDATRGGGACFAKRDTGTPPCSSDAACGVTPDFSSGRNGWAHYCYAGQCYTRPGSQPEMCYVTESASPNVVYDVPGWSTFTSRAGGAEPYLIACMTKAAGPSKDCRFASNLYMRTLGTHSVDYVYP